MTTEEYERRFNGQDLKESLDFIEWWGEFQTLKMLKGQKNALQNAAIR